MKKRPHVLVKGALIAFECQKVIGSGLDDGDGDLELGAHGIHTDDGSLEVEMTQQFGNGGDFIAFLIDRLLGECDAVVASPCADDLDGAFIGLDC